MIWARITLLLATAAVGLILAGCGEKSQFQLRIYDTLGQAETEVTASDVLPGSVRVQRLSGTSAGLFFRFTSEGKASFHRLTRTVARRGARLGRLQRIAIEINGTVYARPSIDYRLFPDGDGGERGLEIAGLDPSTARRLADQMRKG